MEENLYAIVTLHPFYQLTKQSAGAPKKFLVEVPKAAIEKFGNSGAAESSIAIDLATKTALDANTAHFGLDNGIEYGIDRHLLTPEQGDTRLLETPYVFNDCRAWVQ